MSKLDDATISEITKRRMEGDSIRKIEADMGLSRATVSKYCKGMRDNNKRVISQVAATRAFSKNWRDKRSAVRDRAKEKWPEIRSDPELLAFIAFYWAEGNKRTKYKTGNFRISNSDPGLLAVCVKTLKKLDAELTASVAIYEGQNAERAKTAWCDAVGIEPTVRVAKKMNPNELFYSENGTCTIGVRKSFELWHSIMTWIECWRAECGIDYNWQLTPRY